MSNRFYKIINIKEDEEIIKIVRRYSLTLFFPILIILILIITPFFFLFPLFSLGFGGVVIFFAVLLIGIIYGLRIFIIWLFNAFIITNQRVVDIDQRGFFDRIVSEAAYGKIQDVSYRRKGIRETLFHYGTLQIQTLSGTAKIRVKKIHHPEIIQELVGALQYKSLEKTAGENKILNKEKVKSIWEQIKNLGDEELKIIDEKIREKLKEKKEAFEEMFKEE